MFGCLIGSFFASSFVCLIVCLFAMFVSSVVKHHRVESAESLLLDGS